MANDLSRSFMLSTTHWQQRTPDHVLRRRRDDLLDLVGEDHIDSLIVFGHGSALGAGTKSHGSLRFLSDWDGYESSSLLVLTRERCALLLASPFMLPLAEQQRGQDMTVSFVPEAQWASYLCQHFNQGSRIGCIGIEEAFTRIGRSFDLLFPHLTILPMDHHLNSLRLCKDETQLAMHRQAAALCDLIFARFPAELCSGQPVWRIRESLESYARQQGADYCKTWLTVRPEADYPRYWPYEGQNTPSKGDQAILGIMLTIHGHWGHGIRMGSIGQPRSQQVELLAGVENMMQAGLAALQPGQPLANAEKAMGIQFDSCFSGYDRALIRRFRNGHGLGFSYEEPLSTQYFPQYFGSDGAAPVPSDGQYLKENMLFELHPNIFIQGTGGAAIGEMVWVTGCGPQELLATSRDIFNWG
jgi:Xaa-Pro aminopeptidase